MKKIVIATLLLVFSFYGMAQQIELPRHPAPQVDYLKKSRKQKTAAWVLLSAGTAGVVATAVTETTEVVASAFDGIFSLGTVEPEPQSNYTVPYVLSFTTMAASIPFFISAAKNKRAARANAYMKMEKASTLQAGTLKSNAYPSLALRVPL
jgi:hypothetical protein